MKFTNQAILAVTTIATVVSAAAHDHHQHAHHHHQHQKRSTETVVVNDVAVKYVFDGVEVSFADVCHGLANGTFAWDPSVPDKPNCDLNAPAAAVPEPEPTPEPTTSAKATVSAAAFIQKPVKSSSVASAAPTTSSAPAVEATPAVEAAPVTGNFLSLLQSNPGVDADFPDGQLPCTMDSLTKYGAVPLDYLGRQGFTAIVNAHIANGFISGLTGNLASGSDGSYYSYACPEGYMKSQWPSQSSSQTVGGVRCSGGVFHLTNPNSSKLCTAGAGSVKAINNVDKVISVCNTDYPATEDETVPHRVVPGGSTKLAITDSGTFFRANGASMTSAQYYLNPAGYDIEEACQWGTNDGRGIGNWAPVNLGLGTDGADMVYIGLFSAEQVLHDPASPGKPINLNYNIKVSASGQTCEYKVEDGRGTFYLNGESKGYLGQTFDGLSVPGATCAAPIGSDMTVTFY